MARITPEQRKANTEKYNAIIVKLFLANGWNSVTYDNIAKIAGVRKSTLQGYYPSNKDFGTALKGRIFPIFISHLDFTDEQSLIGSWNIALDIKEFRMVISMFIANSASLEPSSLTIKGMQGLISMFAEHFGIERATAVAEVLLGKTVLKLINI